MLAGEEDARVVPTGGHMNVLYGTGVCACVHVCLQICVCRQVLCVCVCVPQAAGPSAKSPNLVPSREGAG